MMRNQSGCPDPTAEKAIRLAEPNQADKSRPLVYICIPQLDDEKRVSEMSKAFCRFAVKQHKTPILPFMFLSTYFGDLNSHEKWQAALEMDKEMLLKCSEIWIMDDGLPTCMVLGLLDPWEVDHPIRYYSSDVIRAAAKNQWKKRK